MHSLNSGHTYFHSGQEWLKTRFLSCLCLTWWDFSPTPSFGSAAAHAAPRCRGASTAHCRTHQEAWRAAMRLAIAFLQSCELPAFPWRHTSLPGTSLLTRVSTSAVLVSISRRFCLIRREAVPFH